MQESWYEKLNRWDEALEAYNRKYQETPLGSPANLEAALGRLRWVSHLSVCLSVSPFVCLSVHKLSTKGSYCRSGLSLCQSVCLSVCLPACLPACLPKHTWPLFAPVSVCACHQGFAMALALPADSSPEPWAVSHYTFSSKAGARETASLSFRLDMI